MANYYNGNNTNPGFTTGNTNNGMQGGVAIAQPGQGFDLGQLLKNLLSQVTTPTATGNSQGGMAVGQSQAQPPGPYQKGVAKALSAMGERHATEAAAHGMSPVDIQSHSIMSPQQQTDPTQVLSTLLATVGAQGGAPQAHAGTQAQPVQSPVAGGENQIQSLLSNILNQDPRGPYSLQKQQVQLGNLQTAQNIGTGQPSEVAQRKAQTEDISSQTAQRQQEMGGQKPIQPIEQLTALSTQQRNQLDSINSQIQAEKSSLDANLKEYATAAGNPLAQLRGGQSLGDLHKAIVSSQSRIKDLQGRLDGLSTNYAKKTGAASGTENITNSIKKAKSIGYSDQEIQAYLKNKRQ